MSIHRRIAQGLATSAACIALAVQALPAWGQSEAAAQPATRGDWRDPDAWKRLRLGMSPAQVVALLGEPGKVTAYYAFERWEYPDALGLRVNFDERGRLSAWGAFAR